MSGADPRKGKRGGWRGYPPKQPERDARIVALRRGEGGAEPLTYGELARLYGITRERARQIVAVADGKPPARSSRKRRTALADA